MPNINREQFKEFVAALQTAVYQLVKAQVPDGETDTAGAIVFPHLVAEINREEIDEWRGTYANNFGRLHAFVIGWGGIKKREIERTVIGTIQPRVTITIEGYLGYSHAAQSDLIFRDEVNEIYLELETNKKLGLPDQWQAFITKTETIEFNHVLIPVGKSDKVHAAFGEISVQTAPFQITN